MTNTKNINIQLRRDRENESKVMDFLEDKPAKFIIVEAVEMYMKAYNAMKEGSSMPATVNGEEITDTVTEEPKPSGMAVKLSSMTKQ